jgi:hypothetical protein
MAVSGIVTFHACHNSGIMISQLGSGTYDHMGFFGANSASDAIIVGSYNDTTLVVDASGNPRTPVANSVLVNNKYIHSSGVSISGSPTLIINNIQDEVHLSSGTLLIWFRTTNSAKVNTYNAKLFVYDNTADIYTAPTDVEVEGYEINASGVGVGGWYSMNGFAAGVNFVDHAPSTNYAFNDTEHRWYAGISLKPISVGFLDDFDFVFRFQFA